MSLKDQLPWIIGKKPHIKASLLVRFIEGHGKKTNKLTMLVGFSSFPHGLELLEGNIFHDKDEPFNNELTISKVSKMSFIKELALDLMPLWGMLSKL
jgi:hypothetical protein